MSRYFSFFLLGVLFFGESFAQQTSNESSYSVVSKQIEYELLSSAKKRAEYIEFEEPISRYSQLLSVNPVSWKNNYAMAIALYTSYKQPSSISYFEKTQRLSKDTIHEIYYFLGNSYLLQGNYVKAKQNYNTFLALIANHKKVLGNGDEDKVRHNILHRIKMCENGKQQSTTEKSPLLKEGEKITISSIGSTINGASDDFGAVFSENDSTLFFTSRRTDAGNIYYSHLKNNYWSFPADIDWPVNTNSYETILTSSGDGNRIYFYKSGISEGNVYYSDFDNTHWTRPTPLLTSSEENGAFKATKIFGVAMTRSKDELFIISDREGGFGGKDIYVSKKNSDTTWGSLENLGALINTAYDEVALSLSPDGNSLYFSSNGDKSIGGFDVFVSDRKDGKWSAPVSLGSPINTCGDDLFFTFLHNSNRACYSSSGQSTDSKDLDIYYVDFCDDVKENTIKGLVIGRTIPTGTITITDMDSKNATDTCVIKDGKYTVNLKVGKRYRFVIETPSIDPVYIMVTIPTPKECKRYDIYQQITFPKPGDTMNVKSAFLNIADENNYPDITTYPELLSKVEKKKLINYVEWNIATHPKTISVTTMLYDSVSGKELSKVTFNDSLFSSENKKIKEVYETELKKVASNASAKEVTTFTFSEILFTFNKSQLTNEYKTELNKAIEFLNQVKPDSKIEISGHTDSKGSEKYNMVLSKKRAQVVANYLISKKIAKSRITVSGYGSSQSIAPNTNADGSDNMEGRAKNRRTEIIIK